MVGLHGNSCVAIVCSTALNTVGYDYILRGLASTAVCTNFRHDLKPCIRIHCSCNLAIIITGVEVPLGGSLAGQTILGGGGSAWESVYYIVISLGSTSSALQL